MDDRLAIQYDCVPIYETNFEFEGSKSPAEAVVEALAAAEDADPTGFRPLYHTIDPESLNRLFDTDESTQRVLCFDHAGWTVIVRGDGVVVICDPDDRAEPTPVFGTAVEDETDHER